MFDWIKSPMVRAILAFVALIVLSLFVWFVGPYIAFGDMKPLAEVATRITVIVMLLVAVIFGLLGWTLSPLLVALASFLLWQIGPLLALGDFRPLSSVWVRVMCIAIIVLVYAVWGLYKLWNLIQNDEAFARRLFSRGGEPTGNPAKKEVQAISDMARGAVAQLKQMHMTVAGGTGSVWAGLRRLFEGKRYLYELPWFMIIGNPGAGKTSVLLNSGLKFPVADQMGAASAQMTLAKNTGTHNCQWWFTNEAVLIDTAGRYTAPDDGYLSDGQGAEDGGSSSRQVEVNRSEWLGFLGVLRQVRGRAPINGAVVAIDVAELLSSDRHARLAQAARLRGRLAELREHLGIRFPVYVMLTKTDVLNGFAEYFSSLTSEARTQVWGFSLPWAEQDKSLLKTFSKSTDKTQTIEADKTLGAQPHWPLAEQLSHEFNALRQRLSDGVAVRMQEEFELDRRQALYVLPKELAAIEVPLTELLDAVFSDSRYDTTQLTHMLRGVYLTSAMQDDAMKQVADQRALMPRLKKALSTIGLSFEFGQEAQNKSTKSYFVTDVLSRVVFPEAHLVKPNLKWEARMKLLRLVGHSLVGLIFFWLAGALTLSYSNNSAYLRSSDAKALALGKQIQGIKGDLTMPQIVQVLNDAKDMPMFNGLNFADPSGSFLYGLYTGDSVLMSSKEAYHYLQDTLVLPIVLKRMEVVMREAVAAKDASRSYNALRAYLLLHDAGQYKAAAQDVQDWVLQDWQESSGKESTDGTSKSKGLAQVFGNSFAMVGHFESMFSGERVVQSASSRDEALVRQVRDYLDKSSSSERLYQRSKSAMMSYAPQDFTLVRALGPQAGTLFSRSSGQTLEKGVAGLFTYDGYHDVFAKRMAEMLLVAQQDDAWVMGRKGQEMQLTESARSALLEDIRRQYLNEYAQQWSDFLGDIRLVRTEGGGTLAFDLNLLRQLASPDSPLIRLGRLAAKETTLSRLLQSKTEDESSIFDKASDRLEQQKNKANKGLGLRPEQRAEKQLVDDRFSSLREVVTGQSESGMASGGKPALEAVSNVLNEYYTVLVVAETAISGGSLPPAGVEAATKLKIEAGKLPAPFREVLLGVSASGADKVTQGASGILRIQAQAQMDRLVGMLALTVGEPCKRGIAGRYPFAQSSQEVAIDDFNAVFASGGAIDEYFNKYMKPLVDTSVRPWRYKDPSSANALIGTEAITNGQVPVAAATGPTLTGELLKLLAQGGPNPDVFAQSAQIREVFFKEPGASRMAWPIEIKVQSLDTSIDELLIDVDGQSLRYAHGPVQASKFVWPGPRGGTIAEVAALNKGKPEAGNIQMRGPWALFRLADRGKVINGASSGRVAVELMFDNRRAVIELGGAGGTAFAGSLLRGFSCPGRVS
jgi:type VI secretion system protein ImpL